jgi:hypothetical protein
MVSEFCFKCAHPFGRQKQRACRRHCSGCGERCLCVTDHTRSQPRLGICREKSSEERGFIWSALKSRGICKLGCKSACGPAKCCSIWARVACFTSQAQARAGHPPIRNHKTPRMAGLCARNACVWVVARWRTSSPALRRLGLQQECMQQTDRQSEWAQSNSAPAL